MLSIIKKSFFVLIIFLIPPAFIVATDWHWQPESINKTSKYLFWFTETAGMPWAFLTCVFFTIILVILLKIKSKIQILKLILILMMAMIVGQSIKSMVKAYTAESRPFVLWIESKYSVDDEYFYSLPRSERKQIIKQYISDSPQIPHWLYKHWRSETGYTFPSGHTLFATTWAFLALVLLSFKRHYIFISMSIAWVIVIEISRISLGMHRPIDLIGGTIIAWLIALLSCYLARRWRIIIE